MDAVQQQWDEAIQRLRNHLFDRDIEPLRRELLAYCLRLTGTLAEAEDLQQETMLRGLALCQICGGPENTRAYLFRSAANLWVDRMRRRRKEALLPQNLATSAAPPPAGFGAEWLDFLARTLSPREFEVVVLRDVGGYTGAEAARLLGTTEAAVKMAASRGRRRMRAGAG
jgi:RNA polymerase sigma-70 factor (ECF subfamily)